MGVLRKALNIYSKLSPSRGVAPPPYHHVVQIGDPTLRRVSEPVPLDQIQTKEVQLVIQKLRYVLERYGSVGMSAPQIGVNKRIFVMQCTAKQISNIPKEIVKIRGFAEVPFTVFINPKLKVVNYQKIVLTEGCESVRGFAADVARYKQVEVTGFNSTGEATSEVFNDWTARIAQHEIDHLDGKLYVDTMNTKSLHCTCWEEVNLSKGKIAIPFTPE